MRSVLCPLEWAYGCCPRGPVPEVAGLPLAAQGRQRARREGGLRGGSGIGVVMARRPGGSVV